MKASEIQDLAVLMTAEGPYFTKVFEAQHRKEPPCLAERLQACLADFQLLWNIANSFAVAGLPLPNFPWPAAVHRAYRFCSDPDFHDENLAMAYELQLPGNQRDRDVCRALLLTGDASDESIGQILQLSPGVVADFQTLWWNVRDRRGDLLYLAQLLDGQRGDFTRKLLRLASLTGKSSIVLMAAGIANPTCMGMSDDYLLEQIKEFLVTQAEIRLEMGFMGKRNNGALALVEQYLLDADAPVEEQDILIALSRNKEAQRIMREHFKHQIEEQLAACRKMGLEAGKGQNAILALIKAAS